MAKVKLRIGKMQVNLLFLSACTNFALLILINMGKETCKRLLNTIQYPDDLRKLRLSQLPQLCDELRQFIIDELSHNPGHFGSTLGVIELTVALHYVYNTPNDKLVWDVGHQAYAHKILTGRRGQFHTNRKYKGIRPFPSPEESEYDTFTCGHASNSISAALGMAIAAKKLGDDKRRVVAIIGDGAMSGGLAFEGLNNVSESDNNMLIVLNDNKMSIDNSVGGFKKYLLNLTTTPSYNKWRYRFAKVLHKLGLMKGGNRERIIRFNNSVKSLLTKQQNIFEGMNIRYFGPVDGHDVVELVRALRTIKDMRGPKMLHIHTIKGKGFAPAEEAATEWHAPGLFDAETGERFESSEEGKPPRFQDVFGHTVLELAKQNKKIVGVTPAMPTGCSLNIMMEKLPCRCFDVGIAEGHAVTFSGGMAKDGMVPFCNIYSSFLQRAYDNIIHDVAIQRLNVVLCIDRGGLVGEDGPTHHGAFDLAFLRPIPNLTIASPYDEHELRKLMFTAQLPDMGPFAIRYPRGRGKLVDWRCPLEAVPVGRGRKLHDGTDVAILSLGSIGNLASEAIARVEKEGVSVAHYDMRFLKPIDEDILHEVGRNFTHVITLENGVIKGGLGSAVLEFMADNGYKPDVCRLGLPDAFVEHGSVPELCRLCHIDIDSITDAILRMRSK